jgi:hypothetical protein
MISQQRTLQANTLGLIETGGDRLQDAFPQ